MTKEEQAVIEAAQRCADYFGDGGSGRRREDGVADLMAAVADLRRRRAREFQVGPTPNELYNVGKRIVRRSHDMQPICVAETEGWGLRIIAALAKLEEGS